MKTTEKDSLFPRRTAIWIGAAVLSVALLLSAYVIFVRDRQSRERMQHIAISVANETRETLLSYMNKVYILQAHLVENDGSTEGFEEIAELMLSDENVRNVLFAPGGIVNTVYPLQGNESVIGFDMSADSPGNREAQAAIAAGDLYLAGPFPLVQGGMGISGRLPVYLTDESGRQEYWGLVSITLKFPDILEDNVINRVQDQGYACKMWRIDPDTGEEQTILSTESPADADGADFRYEQDLLHSVWTVSISHLRPWYAWSITWICALLSVCVAVAAAYSAYNRVRLRMLRAEEKNREIRQLRDELERKQAHMLLSQISSHFFYHTLNSLQALIILEPESASKMAGDFSRYMRFNLDTITSPDGICTFKEELRAVKAYADINIRQLEDRLQLHYDIPDVDFYIPTLTLQPVVENAILHGIKPKEGGGTVTVALQELPSCWQVQVTDDGVGFAVEELENSASVGLKNVRTRLSQFAGCSMEVHSAPDRGTQVTIRYEKTIQKH